MAVKNSPNQNRGLAVSSLESWLWEAACVIRGPVDAPKFKDYILPLIFLKRLSDVFDVEPVVQLREAEEELEAANQDLEAVLKRLGLT
jgi:type I restriction enzyme M protein